MKKSPQLKNIIIFAIIGVLAVSLVAITFILNSGNKQSPELTSNVRAASMTYKRTLNLIISSPTPFDLFSTPESSESATITPTSIASASASITPKTTTPTTLASPTEYVSATASATATPVSALPRTGWTQNVSIMFIAASVLMFLSFLF